jgi:serine/threonine-protein kinase
MPTPFLLQRLKERKLVQWALAYLAGAFFVYTGLDPARETWGIPETVIRGVHILLIAGFFITLVLAWYHGEKGRQRVSGPELVMVAALLVVAGVALNWVRGPSEDSPERPGPSKRDVPRIAVLPCANMSPRPEDAFRAEGLHQEIISRLQGISSLLAIGRSSVLRFADDRPPVPEIAGILPADFVGECSVFKDPDQSRIRIMFQLLDAGGIQVWNDSYDRDLTLDDLYDVLTDIAQRIADAVGAFVTPAEQGRIASRPTESQEAWDAYLQGRALNSRPGTENSRRAIELLTEATRLDPEFAGAWVQLGTAYRRFSWYTGTRDPGPLGDSAQVALERGAFLDDQNAEAFVELAYFLLSWKWDLAGAERAIRRALALAPDLAIVHHGYGYFLMYTGDSEQVLAEMRRAWEKEPFNVVYAGDVAWALEFMGRYDEAKAQYERALEIDPTNTILRSNLGWVFLNINLPDSALAEFERLEPGDDFFADAGRVHAYLKLGDRDAALRLYEELRSIADSSYVGKARLAVAALPIDEDEAYDLLARAVNEHDPHLLVNLMFDREFWDSSRLLEILHRMGLDLEGERLVVYGGSG